MKFYARTDTGRVRPINEDSFYLPAAGEKFCAVADGMGGHNAGEVASALAIEVFSKHMRDHKGRAMPETLRTAVERANSAVFRASRRDESKSGMGTTFSALATQEGGAYIAHVGDSRVYLIRRGAIMQLTLDHTLVEEMVLKGLITLREARVHPKRNIITRALGTEATVDIDLLQIELHRGDVFFLCSDGLSNCVQDREILQVVQGEGDWNDKLRQLVGIALENGGPDNITAMFAIAEEAAGR